MRTSSFIRNERGAIAVLFGLMLIPVVGMLGAALDYSRATNSKTDLQAALDATALAVARAPRQLTGDQLQAFAEEYFRANHGPAFGEDYELTTVRRDQGLVTISASGKVPTTLMGLLGIDVIDVAASTEVVWSIGRLEVALVLDNTGSMSQQGRMTALKQATQEFLDVLEEASYEPGLVKVSIVPFDVEVRPGTQFSQQSWLRWSSVFQQWLWNGCVHDRDMPHDVGNAAATSSATRYPAVTSCSSGSLATIQPLTEDFNVLRQKVTAMQPAGWTNITIGVVWGMATLSPWAPYTQAVPYGTPDVTKIMVVMTDGMNTRNRWTSTDTQIDARTRAACQSAKDTDIVVYTVRFMEGNEALLRDCASDPGMYYNVTNVSQLLPAFQDIGQRIMKLRLSS